MSIKDRLFAMRISLEKTGILSPTKLGYVNCTFNEKIKEEKGIASVSHQAYRPYNSKEDVDLRELDTLDFACDMIRKVKKEKPSFKGIIYDAGLGLIGEHLKTMQMYADTYDLPVLSFMNGQERRVLPTNAKVKTKDKSNEVG